jgi:Flp pilus assembly protein TadG
MLRRMAGCRRGASASEFAIIAGPLFFLILGTCEAAWQLVTGAALDHAALKASRFGATGSNAIPAWQQGATAPQNLPTCRSAGITWMVSAATNGLIRQGQNLTVTTATWSNLGTVTGTGAGNPGQGGQITSYTIRYLQPFITGRVAASFWGSPGFVHQTTIVIKNEPFDNTPC